MPARKLGQIPLSETRRRANLAQTTTERFKPSGKPAEYTLMDQVWLSPALPRTIRRLCVDDVQIGGSRLSVDIAGDDIEVRCDGDLGVVRERRVPMSAIIPSS